MMCALIGPAISGEEYRALMNSSSGLAMGSHASATMSKRVSKMVARRRAVRCESCGAGISADGLCEYCGTCHV